MLHLKRNNKKKERFSKDYVLKLIESKDWKKLKEVISTWHASDIAELFKEISIENCVIILRLIPQELQSEVFSELDSNIQAQILKSLTNEQVKSIIMNMDPDDRTELFEKMAPDLTRRLINLLSPEERKEALKLLDYPDGSAGRLMTPDYVAVKPYWTIKEAIEHIRKFEKDAETIDMVYVVDDEWHLLDDIPIRRLILADPEDTIKSIMDFHFVSICAYSDQEKAIKLCEKYNLVALPVTDSEGHLLGIITVDNIIDVLREEQTEDFIKFSAIEAEENKIEYITN